MQNGRGARAGRSTAQCGGPGRGPRSMVDRAYGSGAGGCVDPVHVDRPHRGAGPWSTVDRAPERASSGAGSRRTAAPLAWARARGDGEPGHQGARQGYGCARLGEANAMEVSPSRNVDGKEKLDGDGTDFDGGAANLRLGGSGFALGFWGGVRAAEGRYLYPEANLGARACAETERRRGSRSGRCGPSPIRPEVGATLTGGAHPSAAAGGRRAGGAAAGAVGPQLGRRGERGGRGCWAGERSRPREGACPFSFSFF